MTHQSQSRGFTLLEMMAVLAIIAILAAITVPKLYGVNDRNQLIEMTGDIEQVAAHVRALAMRTSRAAVMEFNGNQIWINTLAGPLCTDDYAARCVQNMGLEKDNAGTNVLEVDEHIFQTAGVAICQVRAARVTSGTCTSGDVTVDAFAFCYAANGQLWIREKEDSESLCTATGAAPTAGATDWNPACAAWAGINAPTADQQFSGAVIRLNRFTGASGTCPFGEDPTGEVLDVARAVHLPAGGHPYSKVEP